MAAVEERNEAIPQLDRRIPTSMDAQEAEGFNQALRAVVNGADPIEIELRGKEGKQTARIPMPAVRLLMLILDEMSQGRSVNVVPIHAEITTQEAADMLNISRPSLIRLLEEEKIPFTRVNKHRRIRVEEVVRYKQHLRTEHAEAMEALADLNREMGF